jgi:hypothetical protein
MPENFPAGKFLRKADKWLGVCIVNRGGSLYNTSILIWTYVLQGCSVTFATKTKLQNQNVFP